MNRPQISGPLPRLVGFLRPFAGEVALSVLLGVITVASGIALLGVSAFLIASAALQPSVAALQVAIVGVRFFGISRAVFRYLERLVSHSVNFRLLAHLRVWFYRRIEPLAPARLMGLHSADLLSRAIADIETLENFYVRAAAPPLVALLVTVGVGWFFGRYDPRLGLLLIGALALGGVGLPLLAHALAKLPGQAVVEQRSALNAAVLDAVQGMPDLLAFGQAEMQRQHIAEVSRALGAAQLSQARAGAVGNAFGGLLTGFTLVGVLWTAIPQVGGRLDGVELAVLALVTLAAFEAVTPLTTAAQHLESSIHAARRLFGLVDAPPEAHPPAATANLSPGPLRLVIRDLSFSYPDRPAPVLSEFSLDLPAGKHIALIGPSGAGKTTLINLLMGFWPPADSSIAVDGQDIRCLDVGELRQRIALIPQSTYLFAGTLRQNLMLANPGASAADLQRAIDAAQLADWVAELPDGIDTWIGERGLQLSGGERQRVAVARALLRDARLFLLDEPTTNLDAKTERSLLEILEKVTEGRSLIYITHRLAGLEKMDEIIVMRQGRIAERGTHAHLMAQNGLYAQMVRIHHQIVI